MNVHHREWNEAGCSALPARDLLSLKEAVILAEVPEKRVRKDIETGVLAEPRVVRLADARLCFNWADVYTMAAVYSNSFLNGRLRKVALDKIHHISISYFKDITCVPSLFSEMKYFPCLNFEHVCLPKDGLSIDRYIKIDVLSVCHQIMPRLTNYARGLHRIEENNKILGGEAVFCGTRISVSHIGKMYEAGEAINNIVEDYPSLNEDDIRFALLYHKAHPAVGRPRADGKARDAEAFTR